MVIICTLSIFTINYVGISTFQPKIFLKLILIT
jgi:hypothetical protein